jgi:hypothetical protein
MNVYAHARDAFDDRAEQLGRLFAVPAAIAVQNAQVLAQTQRLAAQLQSGMTNRAVIDQAIGILRSRTGESAGQAADRLRALSQRENTKMAAVADAIVREAVRRARLDHRADGHVTRAGRVTVSDAARIAPYLMGGTRNGFVHETVVTAGVTAQSS